MNRGSLWLLLKRCDILQLNFGSRRDLTCFIRESMLLGISIVAIRILKLVGLHALNVSRNSGKDWLWIVLSVSDCVDEKGCIAFTFAIQSAFFKVAASHMLGWLMACLGCRWRRPIRIDNVLLHDLLSQSSNLQSHLALLRLQYWWLHLWLIQTCQTFSFVFFSDHIWIINYTLRLWGNWLRCSPIHLDYLRLWD